MRWSIRDGRGSASASGGALDSVTTQHSSPYRAWYLAAPHKSSWTSVRGSKTREECFGYGKSVKDLVCIWMQCSPPINLILRISSAVQLNHVQSMSLHSSIEGFDCVRKCYEGWALSIRHRTGLHVAIFRFCIPPLLNSCRKECHGHASRMSVTCHTGDKPRLFNTKGDTAKVTGSCSWYRNR